MTPARPGAHRRSRPPARVLALRWAVVVTGLAVMVALIVALTSGGSGHPVGGRGGTTTSAPATTATTRPTVPAASGQLVAAVASWHLPAAVSRAVVVSEGKDLLVLGGLATGDVSTADVVQVDPAGGTASVVGHLDTAVHDAAGADLGGRALVFGGGAFTTQAAVQTWSGGAAGVASVLPVPRSDVAAAVVGGTAYVVGGFDGTSLVAAVLATRDGVRFEPAGQLVQPVRYPAVTAAGGLVYVVGGELATTEGTLSGAQTADIQVFDPATGATRVIGHLPAPLGHATAFTLDGQVYVAGGRHGADATAQIWRIDPSGSATRAGALPFAYSDMGSAVVGGTAFLVGGETTGPTAPIDSVVTLGPA